MGSCKVCVVHTMSINLWRIPCVKNQEMFFRQECYISDIIYCPAYISTKQQRYCEPNNWYTLAAMETILVLHLACYPSWWVILVGRDGLPSLGWSVVRTADITSVPQFRHEFPTEVNWLNSLIQDARYLAQNWKCDTFSASLNSELSLSYTIEVRDEHIDLCS